MQLLATLIIMPFVIALVILPLRSEKVRTPVIYISAALIAALSLIAFARFIHQGSVLFEMPAPAGEALTWLAFVVDVALAIYIIVKGVKHHRPSAIALAIVQLIAIAVLELSVTRGMTVAQPLYSDALSLIMVLIIGIIGSGICVYAVGYMRDWTAEHEAEQGDKRPRFFSLMFAFLGAMFLLVTSNDLRWLLCAWEITTVCSFALIGYSGDETATRNAFTQIILNLVGGIVFTFGIILTVFASGSLDLVSLIDNAQSDPALIGAVTCLVIAGLIKAAQMPVHRWLLGAMVAPTPTSALLHSSTMVKAGVFLIIKLAPALGTNIPGYLAMFVGGASFLICALCAISQRNAKRVLAYSTISNLGLIAACAGTGTSEGVWAAIFLIIFHALAKSLLFCCVGSAEHRMGSRDIERMDLLFERMPRLTRCMILGMMVMFIAPFGMLISKWAALQSFIDAGNLVVVMLIAFGSAATFLFWAKWIAKLVGNTGSQESLEGPMHGSEWTFIYLMSALSVAACITLPWVSSGLVIPYLDTVWRQGTLQAISGGDLALMAIMSAAVAIVVLALPRTAPAGKIYLSGATVDSADRSFQNSFSAPQQATRSNWYLSDLFPERRLDRLAIVLGTVLMASGFFVSVVLTFISIGVM